MNAYEKLGIVGMTALILVIQGITITEWYNQLVFIGTSLLFIFGHKL